MTGGYIMNIQNFSVNDGEGIRTNIFLAGCPLRCAWCSNPEGWTLKNSMTSYMTTDEVIRQVEKQLIFYRHSGGGVTFSGGEATVQMEFLRELAGCIYDMGVSLAIETCGEFEFEEAADVLRMMDLIFLDIKHMDEDVHRQFTGVSNKRILANVSRIAKLPVPLVIRIPVICGVNAEKDNLMKTFAFVREHAPDAKLELLPYHTLGEGKYAKLGMELPPSDMKSPSGEELDRWRVKAEEMGIVTVSYK